MPGLIASNMYGNPGSSMFVQPYNVSTPQSQWSWGGASTGDYMGFASSLASMAGNAMSQFAAKQQSKADAKTYENNAKIARENIRTNNYDHAINAMLLRHNARSEIDSSRAKMIASGNIGSSADAAVEQAYRNLDLSLSNMKFNYDTREVALENEARMNEYRAKEARRAAKKSGLSGILGTAVGVVGGAVGAVFGGPAGAAIGMTVGSSLGSATGQMIG